MPLEWLEELETRVHEATERLRELQEENRSLQERVDELETKLTAEKVEPAEGSELAEAREENEALREQIAELELKLARVEETAGREREEIRGRVERLTRQLEGLVV